MNKLLLSILCTAFSFFIYAQTEITSPNVSGIWTLSGSPYLVKNTVAVPAGSTLKIDAGVEVRFDGTYYMNVYGELQIDGTASEKVVMCADDTTGWHVLDENGGGWGGIRLYGSEASYTTSYIKHCEMRDMKTGPAIGLSSPRTGLYSERSFPVEGLIFHHNRARNELIVFQPYITGSGRMAMKNSSFYDNEVLTSTLSRSMLMDIKYFDTVDLSDVHFYANKGSMNVSALGIKNLTIRQSTFINNTTDNQNPVLFILACDSSSFRENLVKGNETGTDGALTIAQSSYAFIDNNAFYNNRLVNAENCGIANGGGAIKLSEFTECYVRNNVICNNQSSFVGGAIAATRGRLTIANNTIVNNFASGTYAQGGALYILHGTTLIAKNNIFYGNHQDKGYSASLTQKGIASMGETNIYFHKNFIDVPTADFFDGLIMALSVDTGDNIVGSTSDLMMIDPTEGYGYGEDASDKNFEIEESSICVDAGEATGAHATAFDFNLLSRIVGNIDIGAFELQTGQNTSINSTEKSKGNTLRMYPNPAFDYIMIEGNKTGGTLTIRNSLGQIVSTVVTGERPYKLSLSNLPAGVYHATFIHKLEKSYSTFTVIK